jgi:hypothetical protein
LTLERQPSRSALTLALRAWVWVAFVMWTGVLAAMLAHGRRLLASR